MAWDGTVMRDVFAVRQHGLGPLAAELRCGHQFLLPEGVSASWFLRNHRQWPCDECSAPGRARVKAIQESIQFDDVLGKLRGLSEKCSSFSCTEPVPEPAKGPAKEDPA